MSRIYNNNPLSSLPVSSVDWKGSSWPPTGSQRAGVDSKGILVEGTVANLARVAVTDATKTKTRYLIIYLKVRRAHRRAFESTGREVEPNFGDTEMVRTGYLHSSYKTAAKGKSDSLSFEEFTEAVRCDEIASFTEKHNQPGCIALWVLESLMEGIEIENGDEVRLKTTNFGPFVESFSKLDNISSTVSNYAGGEKVGGSWTDKVFAVKAGGTGDSKTGLTKDNEGAADDEWND